MPGDSVVVITPQGTVTPAGTLPRLKSFKVVGIFEVGMFEFDSGLALVNIEDAQKLYRLDGVSGVRLKLDDLFAAPRGGARARGRRCRSTAEVRDWTRSHANFFRAVQIEKRVMFIILTLIVAVAAFNIVSAQVMVVTDKQADIAILRTLGASPSSIMAIFIDAGRADRRHRHADRRGRRRAARAQHRHRRAGDRAHASACSSSTRSVYYISDLPSDLQRADVVTIAAIALGARARRHALSRAGSAARVNPAEALRYE